MSNLAYNFSEESEKSDCSGVFSEVLQSQLVIDRFQSAVEILGILLNTTHASVSAIRSILSNPLPQPEAPKQFPQDMTEADFAEIRSIKW